MIDLRNIETFFWVATLGGFRAAAEKLSATQPAISQRIASLESDLGVRLFDRDVRGIKLTAKGRELLSHAERMLQMRRDMQEAARAKSVMSGMLRLGVSETIVHTWLPRLMEHPHDAYPGLMVEIQVDTTTVLKAQLARARSTWPSCWDRWKSRGSRICTCAITRSAGWPAPSSRSAASRSRSGGWPNGPSSPIPPPPIRTAARQMLLQAGVESPRMYGSSALSVIVRMALDGIGTALIAPVILRRELAQGELRILDVKDGEVPPLHYTACWMGPDSQVPRTVAEAAQQIAREEAQRHPA